MELKETKGNPKSSQLSKNNGWPFHKINKSLVVIFSVGIIIIVTPIAIHLGIKKAKIIIKQRAVCNIFNNYSKSAKEFTESLKSLAVKKTDVPTIEKLKRINQSIKQAQTKLTILDESRLKALYAMEKNKEVFTDDYNSITTKLNHPLIIGYNRSVGVYLKAYDKLVSYWIKKYEEIQSKKEPEISVYLYLFDNYKVKSNKQDTAFQKKMEIFFPRESNKI